MPVNGRAALALPNAKKTTRKSHFLPSKSLSAVLNLCLQKLPDTKTPRENSLITKSVSFESP